jgi:glycosyltransferase involved in cell wall biosynthesis
MHIGFIEDTHLHGGTQIWVAEAMQAFINRNQAVSLLAPEGSWVVDKCRHSEVLISTYDWDGVVQEDAYNQAIWTEALSKCDVVVCTVHPPRDGFHCAVFAARCIREGHLGTHLISKTGTIVPEYLREFYCPDETIRSSVIAITDFTRRYLIETYNIPANQVALIYQGTDTARFRHTNSARKEARNRYPLPEAASPIIGSIGSFETRKGHPVLFEALKIIVNDHLPNTHLMMVGDGPDETMLKASVKSLGLSRNVSFFPFTPEPNYIFERLDITILPSLYKEGLPNVLLESMSMGVPVISSGIGGVSEIVIDGETGYMVKPGKKTDLADAIISAWLNPKNYLTMADNARKLIVNQFDKVTQFEKFIAHFYSVTIND